MSRFNGCKFGGVSFSISMAKDTRLVDSLYCYRLLLGLLSETGEWDSNESKVKLQQLQWQSFLFLKENNNNILNNRTKIISENEK